MGSARQQHGKHDSVATNKHATIEAVLEAMFSVRLYNEDQVEREGDHQSVVIQRSGSAVGSLDFHC